MNYIRNQFKEIRSGGTPVLWRKMRALPIWLLWGFGTSKYGSRVTYYICIVAIFLRPSWAEAHTLLAEVLISSGRFDDAFAAWERAFLLKPDWPVVCRRIQASFFWCGQTRAAQSIMQRYIDAQNDFARVHQLDKLGIRFLREFPAQIGHIALLDSYVKMGILGQRSPARPVVLAARPSNKCYLDYWRRYLPDMITDPLAIELLSPLSIYLEDSIFAVMDSSGKQIYKLRTSARAIQAQWEVEGRGALLTLSEADQERGWDRLRTLGVPADAWFVSLHVREAEQGADVARNADIDTYRMAIESIVAHGGWVIRMGDPTMTLLPSMPNVIDYAHSKIRIDWMDVFLWAKCRFFIGTQSGPAWVPPTFGVPCVITNWSSTGVRPWFNKDLCIFKLHWSEKEARHLNFAEVISSALGWAESPAYLASQGIKLVGNTPEEINDVVIEMLDRLEGKLRYSVEDGELQERFNRLYVDNIHNANARIGRDFLRNWSHLL